MSEPGADPPIGEDQGTKSEAKASPAQEEAPATRVPEVPGNSAHQGGSDESEVKSREPQGGDSSKVAAEGDARPKQGVKGDSVKEDVEMNNEDMSSNGNGSGLRSVRSHPSVMAAVMPSSTRLSNTSLREATTPQSRSRSGSREVRGGGSLRSSHSTVKGAGSRASVESAGAGGGRRQSPTVSTT